MAGSRDGQGVSGYRLSEAMDDVADLVALLPPPAIAEAACPEATDMEVADLVLVLPPRGGGNRECIPWHQRSESLLEYARKRKRIKRLEREVGDVQCQKQLVIEALHDLQMLVLGVSRRLGQVHARVTPEAMADDIHTC